MLSDSDRRTIRALEADLLSDAAFARAVAPVARRLASTAGPVVVGVTADAGSTAAVEWAAAEAAGRRCPLRLVHAFRTPVVLDPMCAVPLPADPAADQQVAAQLLGRVLGRARLLFPGVEMSAHAVRGTPCAALLRESRDARLLVLGAGPQRGSGGVQRLLHGSLRSRLTTSAPCPVAVVPPRSGDAPLPAGASVVVGVDGTASSEAAVAFAFRTASRRQLAVTAVHAWAADRPADLEAVTAPLISTEAAAYRLAAAALAPWRAEFPDVPVTLEVVRSDPARALIAGSAGSELVVVGSRGHGRALGAVLGSVSRTVVEGASGPVAVVRRDSPVGARRQRRASR